MRVYRYVALNKAGQQVQGNIEADNQAAASGNLRSQGLYILDLKDSVDTGIVIDKNNIKFVLQNLMPISNGHKIFFFRQLALMLRAGLSLTEGLEIVQNLLSGKIQKMSQEILQQVQMGETFSNAIEKQNGAFPHMAVHMVRSAEASGELDLVMERVAHHMERKAETKREMMTTMLYPGITLLIAIGMFFFLVTGVVPKFGKFFENAGKKLPPETQSLLDLSHFLSDWGIFIFAGFVAVIFGILYAYQQPSGKWLLDKILLRIPVVGSVITLGAMSQIGWGFSMLLRSGLTLVETLDIIKNLIGNAVIRNDIEQAREKILRGQDLGSSLKCETITPLIQQMAAVGEKSGGLEQIMLEAGIFYEETLKAKSKVMSSMLEPAAILLIGGMVAYVYIAFFKAIFAMSGG